MNPKILVIDQDLDIRISLETALAAKGFQVISAPDSLEAAQVFSSEPIDLVLMDIKLPGRNGINFIQKLKAIDDEVEIIVLTGAPTIKTVIQALRGNGAFDFLTKPLDNIDQLIISVNQALERRRRNREKRRRQTMSFRTIPPIYNADI